MKKPQLIALAERLGDRKLVAEVALASDDAAAYLKKFKRRMEDIGVDEPEPDLPWLALVEGLAAREILVELDWKHPADDALLWVRQLAGARGKKALSPEDPDLENRRTDEALEKLGGQLAAAGLALIELDKDSDSYPITVVPLRDLPSLRKLAPSRISHFSGKNFAALEKERLRSQAREKSLQRSNNRWTLLAQRTRPKSTDGVLWQLRHHPFPVEEVRAALPDAPKKDHALIEMVLALHDQPASKVARATGDPKLCLRALVYLGQEHRLGAERLGAAAVLADRLKVKPGPGPLQVQLLSACNLFGSEKDADRALKKLPAAARARLARLADAVLDGSRFKSERWGAAYRALKDVGDAASLAVIEASLATIPKEWRHQENPEVDTAVARIRKRG